MSAHWRSTLTLKTLEQSDAEFAEHAREALRAQGKDPEHPEIDRRFVEWLATNAA